MLILFIFDLSFGTGSFDLLFGKLYPFLFG
jgi:hypothetical protein